ncbi:MAG: hypothetical protein LBP69_10795 [Treponema sp.]|nr:hypothetical protein [Treponema sp.]
MTDGEEHAGRLHYEDGISGSLESFREAQASADPRTIVLAEMIFLEQELQFCHESDTDTHSSLTQAIQSFEDALLSLEAVEEIGYRIADKTYPHRRETRVKGFPKDAFHLACIAHQTRLRNILRAPGINMTEKAVLQQRAVNMRTARQSYIEKQEKALGGETISEK